MRTLLVLLAFIAAGCGGGALVEEAEAQYPRAYQAFATAIRATAARIADQSTADQSIETYGNLGLFNHEVHACSREYLSALKAMSFSGATKADAEALITAVAELELLTADYARTDPARLTLGKGSAVDALQVAWDASATVANDLGLEKQPSLPPIGPFP